MHISQLSIYVRRVGGKGAGKGGGRMGDGVRLEVKSGPVKLKGPHVLVIVILNFQSGHVDSPYRFLK